MNLSYYKPVENVVEKKVVDKTFMEFDGHVFYKIKENYSNVHTMVVIFVSRKKKECFCILMNMYSGVIKSSTVIKSSINHFIK